MDFITRHFGRIRNQLVGLTVSQKLLIGLLIVIMAFTVYMVVVVSAKPEMIELLPQASSPEEINTMVAYLKSTNHAYQVQGDKILVAKEQAYAIRGEMAAAQTLPKDTTAAFAKLADSSDYLLTNASLERRWNYARQEVLTRVLRNFPYISDATVLISQGEKSGLGKAAVPSSASVSVQLKHAEALTSGQLLAIVETVRGAVAGLRREDIHVTDGTRAYTAPAENAVMPANLLEFKKSMEDDLRGKLADLFSYIPNVKIAVNVMPDMSARVTESQTYDQKGVAKAAVEETVKEVNTSEGGAGTGGQPGVQLNVAITAGNGGGAGARSTSVTNDTMTRTEVRFPTTMEKKQTPPGTEIKDLTATISLPRSYFVSIFQRAAKDPKADPADDDPKLVAMIDSHLKRIGAQAKSAISAKTDEQIRVDWFDDTLPVKREAAAVGETLLAGGSLGQMAGQYAKQGILGAVALGALMMMLMMVRRAAPSVAGAEADPSLFLPGMAGTGGKARRKMDPGALDVEDDVIGEANQGEAVLTGIELDDETLQSRKMVDEVSTMIKENPENAASLVKRWMAKGK